MLFPTLLWIEAMCPAGRPFDMAMSLLQYTGSIYPKLQLASSMAPPLRTTCASEISRIKEPKMPIFSFLLKRRLLQSLLGRASRSAQAGRAGSLLGGSFRKAAFAGITAMLVKRMLRRKSF
jgi:hypothetical protein